MPFLFALLSFFSYIFMFQTIFFCHWCFYKGWCWLCCLFSLQWKKKWTMADFTLCHYSFFVVILFHYLTLWFLLNFFSYSHLSLLFIKMLNCANYVNFFKFRITCSLFETSPLYFYPYFAVICPCRSCYDFFLMLSPIWTYFFCYWCYF